jgi:hypothetical protein
MCIDY